MLTDIKRKDGKIFVSITLTKYGPENNKKQKYYRGSVETFLTERGLQPGACLQNSVIHNMDETSLIGSWIFEDLDVTLGSKKKLSDVKSIEELTELMGPEPTGVLVAPAGRSKLKKSRVE